MSHVVWLFCWFGLLSLELFFCHVKMFSYWFSQIYQPFSPFLVFLMLRRPFALKIIKTFCHAFSLSFTVWVLFLHPFLCLNFWSVWNLFWCKVWGETPILSSSKWFLILVVSFTSHLKCYPFLCVKSWYASMPCV